MTRAETLFVFPLCWQACLVGSIAPFKTETDAMHPSSLAELRKLYLTQSETRFAYSPLKVKLTGAETRPSR